MRNQLKCNKKDNLFDDFDYVNDLYAIRIRSFRYALTVWLAVLLANLAV